ncbi:MAG: hypothetical protein ABEJ81_04690 [Haloferacaceae archaeon]
MSSEGAEEYTFVCPACGESLAVNPSMKEALIDRGCVICGTAVTAEAFTEQSAADSS